MAAMTANDVINRATQRANVLGEEEVLSNAAAQDLLTELNLMMQGFPAEGIRYQHTDLLLTDTVNVPDRMLSSLIWMFVEVVANSFAMPIDPNDQTKIMQGKQNLQAFYNVPQVAEVDKGLRNRRYGWFDFTRA